MYKALILDMDGTVMDSEWMVTKSLGQLLAGYGIPLTEELRRLAFRAPAAVTVAALGLAEESEVTLHKWWDISLGMLDEIKLYPGMDAVFDAPIRRGIVTSQVKDELALNLTNLGIADRIEFAVCADELPYQKPRPEPLLHCVEKMGLNPADVLYVGDTPHDRDCARDAGVDFALAAWGADEDMDATDATFIFQRPEDILEHISIG
jgi:HAD superfamily hydrolase (TIGR01549 family)